MLSIRSSYRLIFYWRPKRSSIVTQVEIIDPDQQFPASKEYNELNKCQSEPVEDHLTTGMHFEKSQHYFKINAGLYNYLKLQLAKNYWLSDINLIVVYADSSSAVTESGAKITEELLAMFF